MRVWVLGLVLVVPVGLRAQVEDAPVADGAQQAIAQQRAAGTFAAKAKVPAKPAAKAVVLTPLSARERVVQLLDRFTYGPRPGEVDRVLALGADKWVEQQMNPDSVPDGALQRRLNDLPTLGMTAAQALAVFPDRGQVSLVAQEKMSAPSDPMMRAVYEVQLTKLSREQQKKVAAGKAPVAEPTDAEKAAQKKADQAEASRVFGELLALPKNQRMAALVRLPIDERIVLTAGGNLTGDQRNLLFADFNPREKETFVAMSGQVSSSGNIGQELAQGRVLRDILTERQLQQVMTEFWFNHFNVFVPKDSDQWYTTSYERDVIRPHALGSFKDLLLATAESPAMMVYLDNWLSIGPDSVANGVNPQNPNSKKGSVSPKGNRGLNENYGREVMELHTVGVNGGYTQADVTALAAILTGWGVDQPQEAGPFQFDPRRHEPGPKVWLGYVIEDDGRVERLKPGTKVPATFGLMDKETGYVAPTADSMKQGVAALTILAGSPQTAHFISYLLAQYFVADVPPPALVDRLQKVYLASGGDIKTMLRAIIASPEFNSRQYFHTKVKTPEEFVASAFRATATDPVNPGALVGTLRTMGMPLYNALPPTGYYLTADQWMNSTALVDRLNFAYQLTTGRYANQKFDAPKLLATGLLAPGSAGGGAGVDVALRVLEGTMVGVPVSAQTNLLIDKQVQAQPANASATDTLNLLTALVMGSPEFQLR
jgi:uncharacterized protein (DUF1800 family)